MKKRLLAFMLTLVLLLALLPVTAGAANEISTDTTWDQATTLSQDLVIAQGTTLTVKGTITVQGSVTISGGGSIVADTTGNFAPAGENNAEEGIDARIGTVLVVADNSSATLNGVTIDAKSADSKSSLRAAVVNRGATLILGNGAVITGGNASAVASENPPQYNSYGGGGVFVCDGGNLLLKGGSIKKNKGFQGGGVYVYDAGSLTIESGAISENNGTNNGGGIWLYSNSADKHPTLMMTGGQISKNTTAGGGGGVCAHSQSFVYMSGGSISENTTTGNAGGGLFLQGQKFEMTGGLISKNTAQNFGGGVHVNAAASTFTMTGGEISENTAPAGGGVNVQNGQFTMSDSNILKNEATGRGGGVRVYNGNFVMNSGTICENSASQGGGIGRTHDNVAGTSASVTIYGGSICHNKATGTGDNAGGGGIYTEGKLSINAGSITNNTATNHGGGIYIYCGKAAISDGTITGNNVNDTSALGGGIYVNNSAIPTEHFEKTELTLSGSPKIIENTNADAASNIYVYQDKIYQTAALTDGAEIGVSKVNHGGAVVGAKDSYTLTENDLAAYSYDDDVHTVDLDSENNEIKIITAAIIRFHANYDGSTETAIQKVVPNKETALTVNPIFRAGHTIVGWMENADDSNVKYLNGEKVTVADTLDLYAKWREYALDHITVEPKQTEYVVGTTLTAADFTVTEVYDNGETELVDPSDYTVAPAALTAAGDVTVTITYNEQNYPCSIKVVPVPVEPVTPVTPSAPAQLPFNLDAGKAKFVDVSDNAWYASAVNYAVEKGLMNGTGDNKFSPNADTTRGMIVTILARLDGKSTSGTPWYQAGQRWAMEYEISDGTNMENAITREQLVTMLFRYAFKNGLEAVTLAENLSQFTDASGVSAWAVPAMQRAVGQGLIQGSNGQLRPQANASRAEVAMILMRFCELLNQ